VRGLAQHVENGARDGEAGVWGDDAKEDYFGGWAVAFEDGEGKVAGDVKGELFVGKIAWDQGI
jgi:hypothetical protein